MNNYRVEIFSHATQMMSGKIGVSLAEALELAATTMKEDRSASSIRITGLSGPGKKENQVLRAERGNDGSWHHH